MCIYEIYEHIFLGIPFFMSIFVLSKQRMNYDFEADFNLEL